jgi:D-alanyl-D-alanine carboxypeptidase (penicillin-binding protein 5/6)
MENLLNYGFNQFETTVYKPAGSALSQTTVGEDEVNLVLSKPIYTTHKIGEASFEPTLKFVPSSMNLTEVEQGQTLGNVEVWENGEKIESISLISDRNVKPELPLSKSTQWVVYLVVVGMLGAIFLIAKRMRKSIRRSRRTLSNKEESRIRESNRSDMY